MGQSKIIHPLLTNHPCSIQITKNPPLVIAMTCADYALFVGASLKMYCFYHVIAQNFTEIILIN